MRKLREFNEQGDKRSKLERLKRNIHSCILTEEENLALLDEHSREESVPSYRQDRKEGESTGQHNEIREVTDQTASKIKAQLTDGSDSFYYSEVESKGELEKEPSISENFTRIRTQDDPTMTRLLNNTIISKTNERIRISIPNPLGGFTIELDGSSIEIDETISEKKIRDIFRKALHQCDLTYRKRKRGGSYYVYNNGLFDIHEQEYLQESMSTVLRLRHSYFKTVESILTSKPPSFLGNHWGSSLYSLLVEPLEGIPSDLQSRLYADFVNSLRLAIKKSRNEPASLSIENLSHDELVEFASSYSEEDEILHKNEFYSQLSRYEEPEIVSLKNQGIFSINEVFEDLLDSFIRPSNSPFEESLLDELSSSFLDRQLSALSSWERAFGDSPNSKRSNFILRAFNMEMSWTISILLSAFFLRNRDFAQYRFISESEWLNNSPQDCWAIIKRRIARFLRAEWRDWVRNPVDMRGVLEFETRSRFNALGAYNDFLLSTKEGSDLLSPSNLTSFSKADRNVRKKILEQACSTHRIFRKEVFDPFIQHKLSESKAITKWWHLMNQKPESYIGFTIMRACHEGYREFVAVYVPNQGVWISGRKEESNWTPIGNMGIGQGKGNSRSAASSDHWSSFHRNTTYGLPRAWYFSENDSGKFHVDFLAMAYPLAEALFTAKDLHDAEKRLAGPKERRLIQSFFAKDRKEDSPSVGEMVLVSADSLVSSAIREISVRPNRLESGAWIKRTPEMIDQGYSDIVRGTTQSCSSLSDFVSYIEDIIYRQAYHITDARPILDSFIEKGIPKKVEAKTLLDYRKENLTEYDLARVAKALLPKLTLEGRYQDLQEPAKEIARVWAALTELRIQFLMSSIPKFDQMNPVDFLTAKTGILKASNLLFPLRGEIAAISKDIQNAKKSIRTGGKTNQRKLWIIRAHNAIQNGTDTRLHQVLTENGVNRVSDSYETEIRMDGLANPTSGQIDKLVYIERVKGKESLLLAKSISPSGGESRFVLVVQRSHLGSIAGEAGTYICPEIDYDMKGIAKWLARTGDKHADNIWKQIEHQKTAAFCNDGITPDEMTQIKTELGSLYESIFTLFKKHPSANISEFTKNNSITFFQVLRLLTSTSYVTDPRARIIDKKSRLGRPNINRQGFNLEVESSLLGQSSEHFFPFVISVLSAMSPIARRIHDTWVGTRCSNDRLLVGTSYAESSRWPYDIVYFYPSSEQKLTSLQLESTSAADFQLGGWGGTPMAINDLLNRKHQALDEGSIKMMHFLCCKKKTPTKSREEPFNYLQGRVMKVTYDHRLPIGPLTGQSHVLLQDLKKRRYASFSRILGHLETAGEYSWSDEVTQEMRDAAVGLTAPEQELLFGNLVKPKGGSPRSRPGMPKIWVPMLLQSAPAIGPRLDRFVNTLNGFDASIASGLWYSYRPFM